MGTRLQRITTAVLRNHGLIHRLPRAPTLRQQTAAVVEAEVIKAAVARRAVEVDRAPAVVQVRIPVAVPIRTPAVVPVRTAHITNTFSFSRPVRT